MNHHAAMALAAALRTLGVFMAIGASMFAIWWAGKNRDAQWTSRTKAPRRLIKQPL